MAVQGTGFCSKIWTKTIFFTNTRVKLTYLVVTLIKKLQSEGVFEMLSTSTMQGGGDLDSACAKYFGRINFEFTSPKPYRKIS